MRSRCAPEMDQILIHLSEIKVQSNYSDYWLDPLTLREWQTDCSPG